MADKKISALTSATTPLAGTEVLPIVQSGTTVKVAVSDLTAGRAISATQLTLTTGSVIVANGQGIDFSATPGTGTSELFNDYEEGTWTPVGNGITFSSATGAYTKIGRLVTLNATFTFPITASASNCTIGGVPYATNASFTSQGSVIGSSGVLADNVFSYMFASSSFIYLLKGTTNTTAAIPNSYFSTLTVNLTVTYLT
jgi:hypothetical protein